MSFYRYYVIIYYLLRQISFFLSTTLAFIPSFKGITVHVHR